MNEPAGMMQALVLSKGRVRLAEIPVPFPAEGEALIEVTKAGICQTDLELVKGYMEFEGVLGHEFVGRIVDSNEKSWQGKRISGEINCPCGECIVCRAGQKNLCPHRTVLGIQNRNGVFAEYVALPQENLHFVPESITDRAAVFIEPLAAALRIVQQLSVHKEEWVLVMGDGKLGLLAAQVLKLHTEHVWCSGRHERKLSLLEEKNIRVWREGDEIGYAPFDLIVEATGNPDCIDQALRLIKPQGRLVLKSTCLGKREVDVSKIVVDEIQVIGSRCGPFSDAIGILEKKLIDVEALVDGEFPLSQGQEALAQAQKPGVIKVLITP